MKRTILVFVALCVVAGAIGPRVDAQFTRTEWVYVLAVPSSVLDEKAFVLRQNGEPWLLELGAGCRSLWRYNGRWVVVEYAGFFGGVSNTLHLLDAHQSCRIWDATPFDLAPPFLGYSTRMLQPAR